MLILEPHVWDKLIKNHPKVAKFRKKPFPLFYQLEALYEGNLNFTSAQQVDSAPAPTTHVSVPAPAPTAPVPVQISNSEQSTHNDHGYFGTNPFAPCFDGQETSSAHEVQSAPSNQDSRQGEGGSGRKRKHSHIGSAIEDYVDFKKSQTSKTLEALEEKRRRDEEFSIEKCLEKVDSMDELTDEDKSYALELFESEINREMFMKTRNHNVRLLWLKRKIRYVYNSLVLHLNFKSFCN
ncbi:hypothetical protein HU200_033829 [Digitaria exilis]|uniref:Uncharacterized protein n=1 Tax=Digitaria exilis TaxID=1010633 RepID=A0A835BQU9_9POAL|nr:hypothetical protein HU200_033829 [Digitaria exilis]